MAVYKDTIQKWDPPNENVPVIDSDRDRILNNIRNAFRQGFEIDVTKAERGQSRVLTQKADQYIHPKHQKIFRIGEWRH